MKVSPVFDSCTRVLLVDIEKDREVDRKEFYLDALSLNERLTILHKSGVDVVICSGISEVMEKLVVGKKIELISNITGEIESVLKAYLTGELSREKFHGPGVHGSSNHNSTHTQE
ncbi:NifB/NifX family molybdenum-iron cluster-binding protein [Breoghania sp.]|uniref:NifB/NifX family molybdenum-iron cluster-binding protein n=1 Tax=Breoghania sp. TaxID=2065378 RepID=UPI0029CA395F|nr:NifB/NifX family molybdenum-iron cluster-binding protein [Breoghania sp.]